MSSEILIPEDYEFDFYKRIALAGAAWLCYKNSNYREALDYFNKILEVDNDEAIYFHCRSAINMIMGNKLAADYDLFRAKLLDMIDAANNIPHAEEVEVGLGLPQRKPLIRNEGACDILQNNEDKFLFCIRICEGDARLPELFYSGGKSALLRRRFDQYITLEIIQKNARKALSQLNEVVVVEFIHQSESSKESKGKGVIREYTVPVRHLPENISLDSISNICGEGYTLFAFLASLVRGSMDKSIKEIIDKEEFSTLAAILAREEEYELLDKYIAEDLPLNKVVGRWFKSWQPTPLYYITISKVWSSMKDPAKMLRYLVAHGADPDIASSEGDTPLGNQCMSKGTVEIMKALLDCGADPNIDASIEDYNLYKPLFIVLLPLEYNAEKHTFIPISAVDIEKAKLLIQAGAEVNIRHGSWMTALGLAITFSSGAERAEIVALLINKGADIGAALEAMESCGEQGFSGYYYALYEFYAGFPDQEAVIPEISKWKNHETAMKYLALSAKIDNSSVLNAISLAK